MQKLLHNGLVKVGNPQRPCAHPTREVLCDCQMLMQAAQGVAVVTQVKCEVEQNYAEMTGGHSTAHESARKDLINHSKA